MFKAEKLACRRGRHLIFRDLGFALAEGDVLRVTGPNGSGKSSLLRLLAGLLPAFDGALYWRDARVTDFAGHRMRLRYLGHVDGLKAELTINEMLHYWRLLDPSATDEVPEMFGLAAFGTTPVKHLSAGQKRRLALSRLALSKAPLWLLDEPSTALDAKGQDTLAHMLAEHRSRGGIAIIATHHDLAIQDAHELALGGEAA